MARDKRAPQRLSAANRRTDLLSLRGKPSSNELRSVPENGVSSTDASLPEDLRRQYDELNQYLKDCDVVVEVTVPFSSSTPLAQQGDPRSVEDAQPESEEKFIGLLGTLEITLAVNDDQESKPCDAFRLPDKAWLYVSQQPDRSMLYFEWPDKALGHVVANPSKGKKNAKKSKSKAIHPENHFRIIPLAGDLPCELIDSCKVRTQFQLVLRELSLSKGSVQVDVYLSEKAFQNAAKTADEISQKNPKLLKAFEYFLNIPSKPVVDPKTLATRKQNIVGLYGRVKDYHAAKNDYSRHVDFNIQHETLLPQLRRYQVHAVRWMLMKEGFFGEAETTHHSERELHPLWLKVTLLDGVQIYYQPTMGFLTREKPALKPMPHGGILADEMGLGKTVEVFALILMHPRPVGDDYDPKDFEVIEETSEASSGGNVIAEAESMGNGEDGKLVPNPESENVVNIGLCDADSKTAVVGNGTAMVSENPAVSSQLCADDGVPGTSGSRVRKRKAALRKSAVKSSAESNATVPPVPRKRQRKVNSDATWGDDDDSNSSDETASVVTAENVEGDPVGKRKQRRATKVVSYEEVEDHDDSDPDFEVAQPSRSRNASKAPRKSALKRTTANGPSTDRVVLRLLKSNNKYTMAYRERLELNYYEELNKYSAAHRATKSTVGSNGTFFDTKVERKVENEFACRCGKERDAEDMSSTVRCSKCSLVQHAECVGWDPTKLVRPRDYICPHCLVDLPPVKSGATLIITPAAISFQWVEEVKKHVKKSGLKVFVYEGMKKEGYVQPSTLAAYDIVLSTYETLGKEVNYLDLPHPSSEDGRIFRTAKRYLATPSPVTCVEWWRLCLDEAQMVESVLSPVATMARRFIARNRWCVTGTPIERSVSDLYGLFLFLEVDPYSIKIWFEQELLVPFFEGNPQPLVDALGEILWRTCKRDVVKELGLPEQTQIVHKLSFSAVEEHFYRRIHVACSKQALDYFGTLSEEVLNTQIGDLPSVYVNKIMAPLLALRQACCHPSVVRAGTYMPLAERACVTMEKLLEQLIKKTKTEAEESLRTIASSLNGMAGIDIIRERFSSAAASYREVIRLASAHEEKAHMDSLQKLHALHNLAEVLFELTSSSGNPVARASDDETLRQRADDVRGYLTGKATQAMLKAENAFLELERAVKENLAAIGQYSANYRKLWVSLLMHGISEMPQEGKNKLFSACLNEAGGPNLGFLDPKLRKTQCLLSLGNALSKHVDATFTHHQVVNDQLKALREIPTSTLVAEAVECHLRRDGKQRDEDKLCTLHQVFDLIEGCESYLFDMKSNARTHQEVERETVVFGELRRGTWHPSKVETVLNCICRRLKYTRVDEGALAVGNLHLKAMEAMRKEFKSLRVYWRAIFDVVSVTDELAMCISRLELGLASDYPRNVRRPANVLFNYDLLDTRAEFVAQKRAADRDLTKRLGQLAYLSRLQEAGFGSDAKNSSNDELCPVCRCSLGRQWACLTCAHCYCLDCIRMLVQNCSVGSQRRFVKCAVCRQDSHQGEISYIVPTPQGAQADSTAGNSTPEEEDIEVVGNVSTKIGGLIVALKRVLMKEPEAKSIIFSSWGTVLELVGDALRDNGIEFQEFLGKSKGISSLRQFKTNSECPVLLMPIHLGSKGLNLTEATHVFFVEQILNPGVELQAIGRVDRIGQTKPTFVHRFVISRTVEENLSAMLYSNRPRDCSYEGDEPGLDNDTSHMPSNILLKDLKDLFVDR